MRSRLSSGPTVEANEACPPVAFMVGTRRACSRDLQGGELTLLATVVHRAGEKPDTTYPIDGLHPGDVGEVKLRVDGKFVEVDLDEYEIIISYTV
jgi:hypothetical protein